MTTQEAQRACMERLTKKMESDPTRSVVQTATPHDAPSLFEMPARPQPAPLKYSAWHTPLFHPSAIVTVVNDMPSNSHNANGYSEEIGDCWRAGTYLGRLPDSYSQRVKDVLTVDAAQGTPSVAYMVLGWEETIVIVPESWLPKYIEPGRYCRRHDMDKHACRCRDDNDRTLEEHYLQKSV